MKKIFARLGVGRGGDGGAVVGILVQEVTGSEDKLGAVLQELIAYFTVQDAEVVVHRVGVIATIQVEVRGQRESPLLEVVPDVQLRGIAEDVLRFLRHIARHSAPN